MGLVPLDWTDIAAFVSLTGLEILPEEARLLRSLSAEYIHHLNNSKEDSTPCPYSDCETKPDNADSIKEQMQKFKNRANKRFNR